MEELRKNAARLAIWNLAVPVMAGLLTMFALSVFINNGVRNSVAWYVLFLAFTEIPLYIFYFIYWFRFLDSLKTCYDGNETVKNAVTMGNVATILKAVCFALGNIASLIIIVGGHRYNGTINGSECGLMPTGGIENIAHSIMFAIVVLMCIMFLMLREMTEKKSEMRYLTLILPILIIMWSAIAINKTSPIWAALEIMVYVAEAMFFWKIYRGYVFADAK